MNTIFVLLFGAVIVGVFIWLTIPSSPSPRPDENELIDLSDSRQIGLLVGLSGGSIVDAATAQFALERFEQIHGRKATTQDVGIVAGLITGSKAVPPGNSQ